MTNTKHLTERDLIEGTKRSMAFRWMRKAIPHWYEDGNEDILPGLEFGVDETGDVWAWCGVLVAREDALLAAGEAGEPIALNNGNEFLRVEWMRQNLLEEGDDAGRLIADLIEAEARAAIAH